MKKITFLTLFTILCFGLQAQFTAGIYGGMQYNYFNETKTIIDPQAVFGRFLYPNSSFGIVIGLQAQKILWDYLVLSNETGYSLQNYEKNKGLGSQEEGELLSSHFINTGLMVGIKPFARSEYLIRGVMFKSGLFLNYIVGGKLTKNFNPNQKLNYSIKLALVYKINSFGFELFMTRQLNTFWMRMIPDFEKLEYNMHAYGLQVSYDLF